MTENAPENTTDESAELDAATGENAEAGETLTPKQKKVRAAEKRVAAAQRSYDKLTGAQRKLEKAKAALEWVKAMPEDASDDDVAAQPEAPDAPAEESPAEQTAESVESAVEESPVSVGEAEQTGLDVSVEPATSARARGGRRGAATV